MEDGKIMIKINVLYEDNHIIVVEKPFNILSQGDSTGDLDLLTMVKDYIKVKYNKPGNVYIGLVHRLDRPTGGIMVFARTSKAASRLNKQFLDHTISKNYLLVCHGLVDKKGKMIDKITKLDNGNSIIDSNGKEASLDYELIDYNKDEDISFVKVHLNTGRHHQIRVQFASRNHPLCGDKRYGIDDSDKQLCLYSYMLEFVHPVTKETMKFESLPKKFGSWTKFTM